jgi:pimeloyl-ACP methyl ester carboxylesterase
VTRRGGRAEPVADAVRQVATAGGWPVRLSTHLWNPNGTAGRALLLHGLGSDGATWWRVASHLADRGYLVAAPDLRSHGTSPTADDHRIATLTEDVALLGTGWDLVVGHSLGGSIAACLLARDDLEVAGAVLLDPVLTLPDEAREEVRAAQRANVGSLDAAEVAAANPRWEAADVERKVLAAAAVAPDVVDRVLDHNPGWDLVPLARLWRGRVHLVAADPSLDALLAPAGVEALSGGTQVTSETVVGAGHSVHRDDPATVLAAIDRLLEVP